MFALGCCRGHRAVGRRGDPGHDRAAAGPAGRAASVRGRGGYLTGRAAAARRRAAGLDRHRAGRSPRSVVAGDRRACAPMPADAAPSCGSGTSELTGRRGRASRRSRTRRAAAPPYRRQPPPVPPPPRSRRRPPGSSRCAGTEFGAASSRGAAGASGLAIGALIAGIASILVSLLVICFGLAGARTAGAPGRRRVRRARGAAGRRRDRRSAWSALRQIRRRGQRRRSGSPAAGWPSPGSSCGGDRRWHRAAGARVGRSALQSSEPVTGPAPRTAGDRRHAGTLGDAAMSRDTAGAIAAEPRFDLRAHGGYSFPSCPGLPGQLVRAPSDGADVRGSRRRLDREDPVGDLRAPGP